MATSYYNSFIKKLEEVFMMDHAELDFGIYRIMNQKRNEIKKFLENDLLPQVKSILAQNSGGASDSDKARIIEIQKLLGNNIESLSESIPLVREYKELKTKIEQSADIDALENEVYSHLTTFFSRYYEGGDFVSKRRYKDNTYAIPYNGEEVKLYWANSDQYYIKTSEYFQNYTFKAPDGKMVHFVLKEASTEQNNNKSQDNMERRFALYEEEGQPSIEIIDGELNIYFTYGLMPKAVKREDLCAQAAQKIGEQIPAGWLSLLSPLNESDPRTLLDKHIDDYTAKNSFDYFIHKNLGGFLRRELDFYIKNEILRIDDLDAVHVNAQMAKVKAIKGVGEKIIRFLASLEDFQRKLWLKKKMVIQADYCITLDKVPESLYPEVCENDAQREEWVRMFSIDKIKSSLTITGYSIPLTVDFLIQNPTLVLDTAFFSDSFRHKLVSSIEDLEKTCRGLIINSENFQALELIRETYSDTVSIHYIDPPFNLNTGADYSYRTDYKDSTWLTLLNNRIESCKPMLKDSSLVFVRCDYHGNHFVRHVLEEQGFEYQSEILVSRSRNEAGSSKMDVTHEFLYLYTFPGKEVEKYKVKRAAPEIKWTGFLMPGERHPAERSFLGITMTPPSGQHFSLVQEKVDKLLEEHHLRLKCRGCGTLYYKAKSTAELSRLMKKKSEHFKFYDIFTDTLYEGVEDLSSGCTCGCSDFTVQYLGAPEEFINDNWLDISGYSRNWNFRTENSEELMERVIRFTKEGDLVIDYFGGSCSTLAAAHKMNRKWIGVEMGDHFDKVDLPRMKKVLSGEKSGISSSYPVQNTGLFKYIRLEQYEDSLNNLILKNQSSVFDGGSEWGTPSSFKESYMLGYLLDTETKGSLFNLKWFINPFAMTLKATRNNEQVETKVDMVETFNYLIGLNVETIHWHDNDSICVVEGVKHRDGARALVIWRNCTLVNNDQLNRFIERMDCGPFKRDIDIIYVNGDYTLPNLRRDNDRWKVVLIEEEFKKRMFEEE